MITEICGMTPEASTLRGRFAVAAERRDAFLDARAAGVVEADDRRAVAQRHVLDLDGSSGVGLAKRAAEDREILGEEKTGRPLIVPQPVTTPSPGIFFFAMPKSVERCSTNMSNSSNEPSSSNTSMRSRAVACRACAGGDAPAPPPCAPPAAAFRDLRRRRFHRASPGFLRPP